MSSNFSAYAQYYDLLYQDKDFAGEADFVLNCLARHGLSPGSILDLGCGTGQHLSYLAKGRTAAGVDRSSGMLASAERTLAGTQVRLELGDATTVRLKAKFDAVVSLFHVASYQTETQALTDFFATIKAHLEPQGLAMFDAWFGPAVLSQKPEVRVKRMRGHGLECLRIAEPTLDAARNTVAVDYNVFVRRNGSQVFEQFYEQHRMRYLFLPEVQDLLERCGLTLVESGEWHSRRPLSQETWNGYFIARHAG